MSFFTVNLDGNEILVQDGGNARIGIRLFLHDMAPMTGKVTNGEKDWLVFLTSFFEGFVAPHVPIHWIVRMQEKVRALRMNEPIGVRVLRCLIARVSRPTVVGLFGDRCLSGSASSAPEDKEQYADMK